MTTSTEAYNRQARAVAAEITTAVRVLAPLFPAGAAVRTQVTHQVGSKLSVQVVPAAPGSYALDRDVALVLGRNRNEFEGGVIVRARPMREPRAQLVAELGVALHGRPDALRLVDGEA